MLFLNICNKNCSCPAGCVDVMYRDIIAPIAPIS